MMFTAVIAYKGPVRSQEEGKPAPGHLMHDLNLLVSETFHLSQDRSVLAQFEEIKEAWFDGEFLWRDANKYFLHLNEEVKKLRGM